MLLSSFNFVCFSLEIGGERGGSSPPRIRRPRIRRPCMRYFWPESGPCQLEKAKIFFGYVDLSFFKNLKVLSSSLKIKSRYKIGLISPFPIFTGT